MAKMNAARASHPSRIKRVVSRRAPLPFRGCPRGIHCRLALREECLPAAVAGLILPIGCARVSSLLRKNPVKVSFARPAPKCGARPTLSAVTLEGTAYLDRRATFVQGLQDIPTLRLQTLCRMRARGTREIRVGSVRKLWVVEICCGRLRKRRRDCWPQTPFVPVSRPCEQSARSAPIQSFPG